jgi:serine acetyltransferase
MHRLARRWQQSNARGDSWLRRILLRAALFVGRPVVVVRTTSDIVGSTDIAPGVYLSDRGNLIIGARSIGSGTLIHHAVTIGMGLMNEGKPQIGRNVWIGPDCVIYGAIDIGDGATVLPGSVLSRSIPPRTVVSGNPSRIVRANFDNAELRKTLAYDVDIGSPPAREI